MNNFSLIALSSNLSKTQYVAILLSEVEFLKMKCFKSLLSLIFHNVATCVVNTLLVSIPIKSSTLRSVSNTKRCRDI